MDIGREFYNYLIQQAGLVNCLSQLRDERGEKIISIHRSVVPGFDEAVAYCLDGQATFEVNDFLVFRQRDETREACMTGGLQLPESVFFDVQIASHDLDRALKIKRKFEEALNKLRGGCHDDPCERILSQKMCGCWVCDVELNGASEDNQRITQASEMGLEVFDFDLTIKPDWSK